MAQDISKKKIKSFQRIKDRIAQIFSDLSKIISKEDKIFIAAVLPRFECR